VVAGGSVVAHDFVRAKAFHTTHQLTCASSVTRWVSTHFVLSICFVFVKSNGITF